MNLIGYVRVSTNWQDVDMQKEAILEYAKHRNWTVTILEEKESTRKTRPVKEHIIKLIRTKQYDGVIFWKLDRWGRTATELMIEIEQFSSNEWVFVSITDGIDLSTSAGRALARMLAVFAEFERDLNRERVITGIENAKARGKTCGRPKGAKDKKKRDTTGYINNKNGIKQKNTPTNNRGGEKNE